MYMYNAPGPAMLFHQAVAIFICLGEEIFIKPSVLRSGANLAKLNRNPWCWSDESKLVVTKKKFFGKLTEDNRFERTVSLMVLCSLRTGIIGILQ